MAVMAWQQLSLCRQSKLGEISVSWFAGFIPLPARSNKAVLLSLDATAANTIGSVDLPSGADTEVRSATVAFSTVVGVNRVFAGVADASSAALC